MSANLQARAFFIRYTPSNKNLRTLHIMRELLFQISDVVGCTLKIDKQTTWTGPPSVKKKLS